MTDSGTESTPRRPLFQMLAAADFHGHAEPTGHEAVRIDKVTFEEVLVGMAPRLRLKPADHLSGGTLPLDFELSFRSMNDFAPAAIIEQVPVLHGVTAIFTALAAVAKGETAVGDALQKIRGSQAPRSLVEHVERVLSSGSSSGQAASPPPAPATGGDVLAGVGMPAASGSDVGKSVASLIDHLGIPRQQVAGSPQRQAAAALLEEIGPRLHAQMDAILHDADFAALEATWRGLQLLVSRADFQQLPLAVYVLSCRREALPQALGETLQRIATSSDDDGVDAVLADFAFGPSADDLALLKAVAEAGESWYCPVVIGASGKVLGLPKEGDYAALPKSLRARFDAPELVEWRSFCGEPLAEYVAATMPEVAARLPYGPKTVPVASIGYQEKGPATWSSGVWAVGSAMLASVARMGWAVAFTGSQEGSLENMPLVPVSVSGTATLMPTPLAWSDEQVTELARGGLIVLSGRPGQNKLFVMSAPTLFVPPATASAEEAREARLHASLPYRLFANRIARCLARTQDEIAEGMSDSDIEELMAINLGSLFSQPGCVSVGAGIPSDKTTRECLVRIAPPFRIMGRDATVMLNFDVPR